MFWPLVVIVGVLVVIVKEIHDIAEEARSSADSRQGRFVESLKTELEPLQVIRTDLSAVRNELFALRKLAIRKADPNLIKELAKEIDLPNASSEEQALFRMLLDNMSQDDFVEWRDSRPR